MKISVQISYYPLGEKEFKKIINKFIQHLKDKDVEINFSIMSSTISGDKEIVLKIIDELIELYFSRFNSILDLKFSNSCPKL
ncbi:MAG: hypothetical protein FXF47_03205 [Candidatus Mcinerneyibacterium aminivorans]|uniref:Thiamine-binding protein domain-containing protein n=1 Tax=Candidatus Mcinerneyibacterium aminivorans TaxID=2703815 RepID=A0A5D0MK82_9BACT|nr:MAG: hypothetical protein FXF47_03205 [Candidatus Mcinerneyibacterium aminivorans]